MDKFDTMDKISYANPPQKVFRNIEHYKRVRTAILNALSNSKSKLNSDSEGNSYLISRLVVKFTPKVEAEEIFIDHQNGHVVLEAPPLPKGSKETESDRRMYYFNNLVRSVEAIATIGISHIYLVLDEDGRKELELTKSTKRKNKKMD